MLDLERKNWRVLPTLLRLFYARYGPTNENAMHSFCKRADVCARACDIQGASEIRDPYTAHEDEDTAGIFAKMRLYVLILRLTQGLSSRLNTLIFRRENSCLHSRLQRKSYS